MLQIKDVVEENIKNAASANEHFGCPNVGRSRHWLGSLGKELIPSVCDIVSGPGD